MRFITAILFLSVLVSSCHFFGGKKVRGDGNVVSRVREVSEFGGVETGGAIELILTQDSNYSVKVETDNNLQEFVEVYVDYDMLHVYQQNNTRLDPTGRIRVYVSAPRIKTLDVSGASSIRATNKISATESVLLKASGASKITVSIDAPQVKVDLTGASAAEVNGNTRDLTVDASGSSDVSAYDLLAENTDVHLTGASHANVFASVKLDVDASGASEVKYKGNATVNQNTSGASSVKKQ